jgi:hypothetical protein
MPGPVRPTRRSRLRTPIPPTRCWGRICVPNHWCAVGAPTSRPSALSSSSPSWSNCSSGVTPTPAPRDGPKRPGRNEPIGMRSSATLSWQQRECRRNEGPAPEHLSVEDRVNHLADGFGVLATASTALESSSARSELQSQRAFRRFARFSNPALGGCQGAPVTGYGRAKRTFAGPELSGTRNDEDDDGGESA